MSSKWTAEQIPDQSGRTAIVTPGPDPLLSLSEALFAQEALGSELRQGTFRTRAWTTSQTFISRRLSLQSLRRL